MRTAAARPDALVIGIDPNVAGLGAGFSDARRRKLDNAWFAVASAEALPPELDGVADEVRVHFPWAALLDAVVAADPVVVGNLARLLKPGGRLLIALSVVPRDGIAGLDQLDADGATALARRIAAAAEPLQHHGVRPITKADLAELQSSWARRLGVGRTRPAWRLDFSR